MARIVMNLEKMVIRYHGPVQRVEKTQGGFDLIVPLPFASEDQGHLAQAMMSCGSS